MQDKPSIYANRSLDFFKLSPKEFEEIVYLTFKNEIEKGFWGKWYDKINWLDKVGERGRDCTLHSGGKNVGIIQCKHSVDNNHAFSKPECAKEIIKFILHYGIDKSLIYDIQKFKYYFIVSNKFKEDAQVLLTDFKNRILKEKDFEKWVKTVLNSNVKLEKYYRNGSEIGFLKKHLIKLRVETVIASDLDQYLNSDFNASIKQRFFQLEVVVKQIDKAQATIKEIIKNIKDASIVLQQYDNNFDGIENSHIARQETNTLKDWLDTPLKEEERNIAILVGSPGCGKSVILKDLFEQINKTVPVIGIKADRYTATSLTELEKNINLCDSFGRIIPKILETYSQVVIIIDQIDALSQTNSAKGEFISTYKFLINLLRENENVRIILSIREYDLEYDFDFKIFKKEKKITVSFLTQGEVLSILNKLDSTQITLTDQLYTLLKVPYNLDAFCRIYTQSLNLNRLRTTNDLYKELWKQKIVEVKYAQSNLKLKEFVYTLSALMYEKQEISISKTLLYEQYFKEIDFFLRTGLLIDYKDNIQFFHQTFYDFSFAKQFSEQNKSVVKYLKQNLQGLKIRASLKMIMGFYRDLNERLYIDLLEKLTFSQSIRYHIKLLLINMLGAEKNPSISEKNFVQKKLLKSKYSNEFIESINSKEWLFFLINNDIVSHLLNEGVNNVQVFSLFKRHLPFAREIILKYFIEVDINWTKDQIVDILYFYKIWDDPKAFILFDEVESYLKEKHHYFFKILNDISASNFNKSIEIYKKYFLQKLEEIVIESYHIKFDLDYHDEEFLTELYKRSIQDAFLLNIYLIRLLIERTKYNYGDDSENLIYDQAFDRVVVGDNHGYNFLLNLAIDNVQKLSVNNDFTFCDFVQNHIENNFETILRIIIEGFIANPKMHTQNIVFLINLFEKNNLLDNHKDLLIVFRKLIGISYQYFDYTQKTQINEFLLRIKTSHEYHAPYDKINKKKILQTYFGSLQFKYLQCIPIDQLKTQPDIYRKYKELERRHGKIEDEVSGLSMAQMIGPPFSQKAYENMNFAEWENSMLIYNKNKSRAFGSFKGGIHEHSRAFRSEVKKRPIHFLSFIETLITNENIEVDYIIQALEGIKDSEIIVDVTRVAELFRSVILFREIKDYSVRNMVWITDFFIEHDYMDDEILNFLISTALYDEDPKEARNKGDLIGDGINSNRGAAATKLTLINYKPEYSDIIFNTLNKVADDKMDCVKSAILYRLAFLNHIDKNRVLMLFKKLTDIDNDQILLSSIWTVQYLKNSFFEELKQYFRKLIKFEKTQEEATKVLTVAWLEKTDGCLELLYEVNAKSIKSKVAMLQVADTNIFSVSKEITTRCIKIFNMFLDEEDKSIAQQYSTFFLRLDPKYFEEFYPHILKYSKSKVCKIDAHYFINYLEKCAHKYPFQCLKLINNVKSLSSADKSMEEFYKVEKALNVVVHSYNALMQMRNKPNRKIKKSIALFDKLLKNERYRHAMTKVLETVDL